MSGARLLRLMVASAGRPFGRAARFVGTAAIVLICGAPPATWAADTGASAAALFGGVAVARPAPDERMLVESDQLVYDYDNNRVSAVGNVKIYYAGYTLEAEQVTYDRSSGRLIASGRVKMVDPTGAAVYSEFFDITDDFRDGFVQSLRVDTPQRTHFTADSAERREGETTTFVNGVYTACDSCKDDPAKPALWNIKATKIVIDHKEHMVYFTDAKLELFGLPVVWLPYFAMADPSVTRKSGFLSPHFGFASKVGAYASLPYFWAIAANRDITFTPTIFSRQGFLGDVEWRHRLEHGQYSLRMAGIDQLDKTAFRPTSPSFRDLRGGIRTTGEFYLNQDWTLGWDGTLTSDRTFARDYNVLNGDSSETISTIHLTGLGERNFFEARASYFRILTDQSSPTLVVDPALYDQGRQAIVVPVVDYHRIADDPVHGGEVSFTSNLTTLDRRLDDPFVAGPTTYYHGTAGTYVRATQEIAWQRQVIGPMGQVITPFASARGDAFFLSGQTAAAMLGGLTGASTAYRAMPAVGVEWSLPIMATAQASTHIFGPRAQLIVRPNEMAAGTLPNNDAQSLVFDVTNLFDRDKFSGFDRVEGGTRLNVGVQYQGSFGNGASVEGTFGQSIHLAGANPYATPDIANVGSLSGLETKYSDYVAGVSVNTGFGPRFTARSRFDDMTFSIKRAEVEATAALGPVTASTAYLYLHESPDPGVITPASVIRGAASVNLAENWRAFGSLTYDIRGGAIASDSIGLAFDDESLTLSFAYSTTRASYTDIAPRQWLNFRLQLRTLGESTVSTNLSKL